VPVTTSVVDILVPDSVARRPGMRVRRYMAATLNPEHRRSNFCSIREWPSGSPSPPPGAPRHVVVVGTSRRAAGLPPGGGAPQGRPAGRPGADLQRAGGDTQSRLPAAPGEGDGDGSRQLGVRLGLRAVGPGRGGTRPRAACRRFAGAAGADDHGGGPGASSSGLFLVCFWLRRASS